MYIVPQAVKLYKNLLTNHLIKFVYYPWQYTPSIWRHKCRPIIFTLVVDDFLDKLKVIQQVKNLKELIETYHEVSINWKGKRFLWYHYRLELRRPYMLSC